jgi:hypothetical protein
MKTLPRLSLLATLMAAATFSGGAFAASATGTASATVLAPIAIGTTVPLNFGSFAGNAAGSVTIAPTLAGTRSFTGVVLTSGVAGTAAKFTVTGTGNATFGVTYTNPTFNVLNGSGGTMSVTTTGATSGTLAAGTLDLYVGGTLTVAASQAAGAYTNNSSMIVVVEYN